ncbi:hypothetical protein [Deinococcus aquiradiocola]|uniref:Outer membrane protein beta-barrel domain-containing protein n=1 Tax=Deinococcus aquiradiocola TaxID=393059 RepID=A0A917UJ70_9DEIO|nr:hypothetical protein [Deinococcus aquiradiocola]GGJ61967.1 hypothetical protein GCM10008939_02200 [Deinococcus aquiradiocola]
MKNFLALTATVVAATLATAGAQTYTPNLNNVELGLNGGYQQGLSGGITLRAGNVAGPFGFRVGADYSRVNDSLNDDANLGLGTWGTYKQAGGSESGHSTTLSADATYDLPSAVPGVNAYVYGGARYNMFQAVADFGNGGGKTTYTANQIGLGAGVAAGYAITGNLSLTGDLGYDHYFAGPISYNDGTNSGTVSSSDGAAYTNLDSLVNQPTNVVKAKIGLAYRF